MPNILINPNSGILEFNTGTAGSSSLDASLGGAVRLVFSNSGTLGIQSYSTGVVDKFFVEGVNGRLFEVDDLMTGSLMSVNDIAGLPILEVFSDDRVILGQYNYNTLVVSGTVVNISGRTTIAASSTGNANFNLPHGTAPTSPVNGDIWSTTSGLFARINGSTVGPYGTSVRVDDYSTTGTYTWTKPSGAKSVQVICWGAGGGGGGGSGGAAGTARCPGGGGGGGARIESTHFADLVPASVTVTVGTGGTAGAAGNSGSGGNGGAGGNSSFGGLVVAGGGGGGKQGIIATISVGGGGGGAHGQGATGAGTVTVPGGGLLIENVSPAYGFSSRGGDGRGQGPGYQAEYGGGGGGGSNALPGNGPPGGGSMYGGGGGGVGGGITSGNSTVSGGQGGRSGLFAGGGGSNANAGVYPSGDGGNGGTPTTAGSNGGSPAGGGGGGGGGTTNGTAGGTGGNGRVVVITYF